MEDTELRRTARQTLLIGQQGQEQLHAARVLLVGAGGLGCPILQQLAAAGVGQVVLVDDDTVDITNIHRQILFGADDVGSPKVTVAARRAQALQPGMVVDTHQARVDSDTVLDLVAGVDLVIDGTDSFASKYLIADACEITSTPLVWGTVLRFHGDVAVWHSGPHTPDARGVGLRDLFPTQLPAEAVPDCATAGVLGVTTSVVGGLMATAAIAWITGRDKTVGQVSSYDAIPASLRTYQVKADPDRNLVRELGNYSPTACALSDPSPELTEILAEIKAGGAQLLDIREPGEVILKPWPASYRPALLPLSELAELDHAEQRERIHAAVSPTSAGTIYVACASGKRSADFVKQYGPLVDLPLESLPGGITAALKRRD